MAGDFNKPAGSSARTAFMQEIRDMFYDVGVWSGLATNPPVGYKRYNATTDKFEEWNGTAWVDLPLTGQLVGNATVIKSAYTTGGSATAYTVTIPEVAALVSGDTYFVKAHIANTTATPTLVISGLTAKTIKKEGGVALVAGDIPINHEAVLRYNGTDMILLNPAKPTNATNADTVDSYHAAGLLARSAHTGTQDGSTVVGGTLGSTVVPLARMGTVVASGTQAIGANQLINIAIEADDSGDSPKFYQHSVSYTPGPNQGLSMGTCIDVNGAVRTDILHAFIVRQYASYSRLSLVNPTALTSTIMYYKVYKLTET